MSRIRSKSLKNPVISARGSPWSTEHWVPGPMCLISHTLDIMVLCNTDSNNGRKSKWEGTLRTRLRLIALDISTSVMRVTIQTSSPCRPWRYAHDEKPGCARRWYWIVLLGGAVFTGPALRSNLSYQRYGFMPLPASSREEVSPSLFQG